MATKFIILSQVHRSKTSISTRKPPKCNREKPRKSKSLSENILNNFFPSKTLTEVHHYNSNSHPLTDSLLFIEDPKEEENQVSPNCNHEDGKSIIATDYGDLRREVARLSLLWYMKCSISFILRKARAFYNEFCCDTYVESNNNNNTMVLVDPYFAVPVLPYSN